MNRLSLLALFSVFLLNLVHADLTHNFSDQRFDGQRYEELGEQPGGLHDFTVIIRLECDVVKNGTYAWALRCEDAQGNV